MRFFHLCHILLWPSGTLTMMLDLNRPVYVDPAGEPTGVLHGAACNFTSLGPQPNNLHAKASPSPLSRRPSPLEAPPGTPVSRGALPHQPLVCCGLDAGVLCPHSSICSSSGMVEFRALCRNTETPFRGVAGSTRTTPRPPQG